MTLYYVTDKEHLPQVLSEGIAPSAETSDSILLCDEEDIGHWSIILGKSVPVAVDASGCQLTEERYQCVYKEYLCKTAIGPEKVHAAKPNKYDPYDMYNICETWMYLMSNFTVLCARYYNKTGKATLNDICQSGKEILSVLGRLDYSIEKPSEWKELLQEVSYNLDGYTFCDEYDGKNTKLWEQLVLYPKDETYEYRSRIHNFIERTFPFAKNWMPGKWVLKNEC